ncbi:MAG: DEAD/DEAH box helicase [Gemmatimonadales bacterium]|nr:DEAD/DEAH box helicase [Gemmatimonadales bacterium]
MLDLKSIVPTEFIDFGLNQALLRGIQAAGFKTPRPIQSETIPAGLAGYDVLGLAQTGTGKTAAFALPLMDRLLRDRRPGPRALVLAPTRELANQIAEEMRLLSRFTSLKGVIIYGGISASNQIRTLRQRPEIVVGCPGRILDLLQQKVLHLDQVETLVLDEADHMFDMGFLPDIRKILATLPAQRQNLLFSATMPKEVRRLADDLLRTPHVVELANSAPAATIDHALVLVAEQKKRNLLEHVLTNDDCESAIIFTRTKHRAKRLADQLCKAGHKAVGIQGNLSQARRDQAMRGFRSRRFNILVATDIVARGIDVSGVSHVINFDVPNTPEAYTHRIGRTGRAELEGVACTFVTVKDHGWLRATERMIGSPIQRRQFAGFEPDDEMQPRTRHPYPRNKMRNQPPTGQQPHSRHHPSNRGRRQRRPSA